MAYLTAGVPSICCANHAHSFLLGAKPSASQSCMSVYEGHERLVFGHPEPPRAFHGGEGIPWTEQPLHAPPALGRLTQEDNEFKASLGFVVRLSP